MSNRTRTISLSEYSVAMVWLEENLMQMKLSQKEIFDAQLLLEEHFARLADASGNRSEFSARISIRKRLGDVSLLLASKGEPYNPIVGINDTSDDVAEMYTLTLLKAHRKKLSYVRRKGENILSIRVHELSSKGILLILSAAVLGCVLGYLAQVFLDTQTMVFLETNFLTPVRKFILNVLMMLVAPLIFFSVVAGFSNMSDAADLVRFGGKLSILSMAKMAVFVAFFLAVGAWCGPLPEGSLSMLESADASDVQPASFSIVDVLVGISPGNIVSPFLSNNLLQVLFMACFFGTLLAKAGDRAAGIRENIDFFNRFFLDAIDVVRPFLPLLVGVSMMQMLMRIDPAMLISYGKLFVVAAMVFPISILLSALLVMVVGRLSPIPYIKKILSFSVIPFSFQSGNICMPYSLAFCKEKLGVEERLSLFSVPAGNQINKNGSVAYIVAMVVIMRGTVGLPADINFFLSLFITVMIINFSLPSVANAEAIVLASIFGMQGIPVETVALFFAINPVTSLPLVPINVIGNITSTLLLARWEGLLDKQIYASK